MVHLIMHGAPDHALCICSCMVQLFLLGAPGHAWCICSCLVHLLLLGASVPAWCICSCLVHLVLHGASVPAVFIHWFVLARLRVHYRVLPILNFKILCAAFNQVMSHKNKNILFGRLKIKYKRICLVRMCAGLLFN